MIAPPTQVSECWVAPGVTGSGREFDPHTNATPLTSATAHPLQHKMLRGSAVNDSVHFAADFSPCGLYSPLDGGAGHGSGDGSRNRLGVRR